jgi:RNA polymerase sigma-70 factor (ECF subfamily)
MEALTRMADRKRTDVLASAAAGDEIAFRRIISEHQEDMRRVCLAVADDHAIAEEATQAAWVVAWQKIGDVSEPAHLRPWLIRVAVNEAKQILRKRRRRAEIEVAADPSVEPGGIDPATSIAGLDLRDAMDGLDVDDRALLAMRFVAGFDSNELARATGISPSGTRSRIERLLKRLREDLDHG